MSYPILEESVRLLQHLAAPAQTLRLSRRVRHLAVASDQDHDVAATMFLRRGVNGEPWIDVHSLERDGSGWRLLGGGSGNCSDTLFTPRPSLTDLGTFAFGLGGGGTLRNADRLMPWGGKWVWWTELRLVAEVAAVQVDNRRLPVAPHGVAVIVWRSRRRPTVVALDHQSRPLGSVSLRER